MFRAFWIASLVSNLGTWVHNLGAAWLMTGLDGSPVMVAAVRTAMSLPMVVLAIPAGVLADRLDRRQLLICTQLMLFSTTCALATLTYAHWIDAWSLLALTCLMGLGMVMHTPTWQASIPELVPRDQLPRAVALGSVGFNLARSTGPAIGGVLIAAAGEWAAFAVNAFSFAGVIAVLWFWKREDQGRRSGLPLGLSLLQGVRFALRNHTMRHVLVGVFLFVIPASALWSLLPLIARDQLGWQEQGFGMLLAMMGAGAVAAAMWLPRMQRRFGEDRTQAIAMIVFGIGLALIGTFPTITVVIPATLAMGSGWMMALTTLNASAQMALPKRLRARGLGSYQTAIGLSMVVGSLVWGQIAESLTLSMTEGIAAVTLAMAAAISFQFPLAVRET